MNIFKLTDHQKKQIEVINKIVGQVSMHSLSFSTVSPVNDYENDPRISITSVHLPDQKLIKQVRKIIKPLQIIEPSFYYYPDDSLHLTMKNVRFINNPPRFTQKDIEKANEVFSMVVPRHKQFRTYFYRLFLFPNSLSLLGTTDPELDDLVLDLDKDLKENGIPDDKVYINSKYFFCNMTLARFNTQPSQDFKQKVLELSQTLKFEPYTINSVTLLVCNAVLKKRKEVGTWRLQKIT